MTITNNNSTKKTRLGFWKHATTIPEAAVLLRTTIGLIDSLSNSLVGKKPLCGEALGINKREHAKVRKFTTEQGLGDFKTYLFELLKRALAHYDGNPPSFGDFGEAGEGFTYTVGSGRARIEFGRSSSSDGWVVSGMAMFKNPEIVHKNLIAQGFEVKTSAVA